MPATKYYPPPAFSFSVGISDSASSVPPGDMDGSFQEVSGIESKVDIEEIAEGGQNAFVHQLPGASKHSNLVLKRGYLTQKSPLAGWVEQCIGASLGDAIVTKTISLFLLGPDGKAVATWTFTDAWPVKWVVAPFDSANSSKLLTQSLELSYRTVSRSTQATDS